MALLEELKQYRAIGTIEEFKKIEESFNTISDEVWNYILAGEELLERYEAIGTVEEFKALKEKSVAKKVISRNSIYRCPTCESLVSVTQTKCTKCSQKLDWQ